MRIKSAFSLMLSILFLACLLCLLSSISYAQSTPSFQSVSGQFAQKWLADYKEKNLGPVHEEEGNGSDLWGWGNAPRGSKIVDGDLVTDPYYLRPLLNLSSNWLGETYTDASTGIPMETYSDPLTGKKIYRFLNPNTGKPFFTYYTYPEANTGKLVYAYVDPMTGNEVYSSSAPIDIINSLAGNLNAQTVYNQNEPWTRL
jgi:hypothetical protein